MMQGPSAAAYEAVRAVFGARAWPLIVEAAIRAMEPDTIVTSWYRDPAHNARVGGAADSQHLLGLAFDTVPVSAVNARRWQDAGFHVVVENDHVHAQVLPPGVARSLGLFERLGVRR